MNQLMTSRNLHSAAKCTLYFHNNFVKPHTIFTDTLTNLQRYCLLFLVDVSTPCLPLWRSELSHSAAVCMACGRQATEFQVQARWLVGTCRSTKCIL